MRRPARPSPIVWAAGLTILVLIGILGVFQYRWLGALSDAEKLHMHDRMQTAAVRFAREFDRELTRALILLDPASPRRPQESYADRRARWASSALAPRMVRDVLVASVSGGDLALARVDATTGSLSPMPWPVELAGVRDRLRALPRSPQSSAAPRARRVLVVPAADVPALVGSYTASEPAGGTAPAADVSHDTEFTIVWLDRGVLEQSLLPDLAARDFGGAGALEYSVELSSIADPSRVIFRAGPQAKAASGRSDAEVELFGLLRSDDLDPTDRSEATGVGGESRSRASAAPPARPAGPSEWRLRLTHPAGSLDAAVASVRNRNLAISFGTLILLAVSMTMVLVATRRAQRLARQQLEFTAGITHELATPLAGMRSAAQNLADGVVVDPAQVRAYGSLIEHEGRRLTEMVDQVLAFAGMQSRKPALERHPVPIREVVEEALATSRRALDERGFSVETELPDGLPDVAGDRPALRRAVENLVANVIKYASEGRWIGIRARVDAGRGGRWMTVAVADHGPGMSPEDLPHVFEPFYRGRGRAASAVPGSGLGLTVVNDIVQSHGGRVDVTTDAGRGTTFTLVLPLAEAGS